MEGKSRKALDNNLLVYLMSNEADDYYCAFHEASFNSRY
jgi:hypothetical protein